MIAAARSATPAHGILAVGLAVVSACAGGSGGSSAPSTGTPPTEVAVLDDGASRDLAADAATVWIAQGRRLAALDGATLERLPQLEETYPTTLQAVELDGAGALYVLDDARLYRRSAPAALDDLLWTAPDDALLRDVAVAPGIAFVLATDRVFLLALDASGAEVRAELAIPAELLHGSAVRAYVGVEGEPRGVLIGQMLVDERAVHALAVLDADAPGGFAAPAFGPVWFPTGDDHPEAEVEDVLVQPDPASGRDLAWVAGGQRGQHLAAQPYVARLDVTDPAGPYPQVDWIHLANPDDPSDLAAHHLAWDVDRRHVLVATDARLAKVQAETGELLGAAEASFLESRLTMVVAPYALGERLWSLENLPHPFPLRTFHVTDDAPALSEAGWWWIGCDAAVHAPAWRSLYLTTFSGVVRYDVGDPASPALVGGHFPSAGGVSYQPATHSTEDATLLDAGAASALVVARGNGGFDAHAVSASAPDPGPAVAIPSSYPNVFYNNAVEVYTAPDGTRYVLADLTAQSTTGVAADRRYYLEAARYHPGDFDLGAPVPGAAPSGHASAPRGGFQWTAITAPVAPPEGVEKPITSNIALQDRWAFVGGVGAFFVVDLAALPGALPVVDVVDVTGGDDKLRAVRGLAPGGEHLFVGLRGAPGTSAVAVYAFDPQSGQVAEEPLAVLNAESPGVPADFQVVNKVRLSADGKRLFACGSLGRLYTIDVSTPTAPLFLSAWQSPGGGHTSDCRVESFELPDGSQQDYVVFVTVSEVFKLLLPVD
ncbi:MAG: hypothetical protein AAF682_24160 [Planctomycetota bacterium]